MANNFGLNLDTTAPTGQVFCGSATNPTAYTNANIKGVISSYTSDTAFVKIWCSKKAAGTKIDDGYPTTWKIANQTGGTSATTLIDTTFSDADDNGNYDGDYYMHAVLMDDVGNESAVINSAASVRYDTVAPVISAFTLNGISNGSGFTNNRTVTVSFTCNDANSKVVSALLSGDITENSSISDDAVLKTTYTGSITLTAGDATKTIRLLITDAAGNTTTASTTITLDTTAAIISLTLKDKNNRSIGGADDEDETTTPGKTGTDAPDDIWVCAANHSPFKLEITAWDKALTDSSKKAATSHDIKTFKVTGKIVSFKYNETSYNAGAVVTCTSDTVNPIVLTDVVLSSNDSANQVVTVTVVDAGGTTTTRHIKYNYDGSSPTASIAVKEINSVQLKAFSDVTGYTSCDIIPTVKTNISGIASWTYQHLGSDGKTWTKVYASTDTGAPASTPTLVVNTSTGGIIKNAVNSFRLIVVDRAGNSYTSNTETVNYDTIAPKDVAMTLSTYSDTNSNYWFNAPIKAVITYAADELSGIGLCGAWVDSNASATTLPENLSLNQGGATSTTITDLKPANDGASYYIHAIVKDKVGNQTIINSSKFGYDTVAPTGTIAIKNPSTAFENTIAAINKATWNVDISTAADTTSGVEKMFISGEITNPTTDTASWETYAATRSVTFDGNGIKQVYVKFRDKAGNVSPECSLLENGGEGIEVDTTLDTCELAILNTSYAVITSTTITYNTIKLRASYTGNESLGGVRFKVYGDILRGTNTDAETEASAPWINFTTNSDGSESRTLTITDYNYKVTPNTYVSNETGSIKKTITLKVQDNAGNITTTSQCVYYDSAIPVVNFTDHNHDRISCTHIQRREADGTIIASDYADEIIVKFKATEDASAYKICAYKTVADAQAVKTQAQIEAQTPIANFNDEEQYAMSSQNGISGNTEITRIINGAKYKAVVGTDGVHYVVIYVKDLGGQWSAAYPA